MSNSNYTLEVISHHPKFQSKSLRKYYVDGIDTVGAWGDEPFEIKFRNNTWQKVQVKISVDGTDVLSGKTATTEVDSNMWVVNAHSSMSLKAWPEDNNGGAAFLFTSANNSVAIHTHGDLSSRGIIAAAVFVEGHVEPITIPVVINHNHNHYHDNYYRRSKQYDYFYGSSGNTLGGRSDVVWNNSNTSNVIPTSYTANTNVLRSESIGEMKCSLNDSASYSADVGASRGLESLVAVGAGQHVDQKITHVTGLIKPTLSETVRVRYMWWDELQAKLRENNVPAPHASGFPGDRVRKNIDLKSTPRKGGFRRVDVESSVYSRI